MRALIGAVVVLAFAGFAAAGQDKDKDKIDAKKLIGKWEPKEGGISIEFADKGKLILSVDLGGKTEKVEGSYKLDGAKLEVVISFGGKEMKETLTIKKLTDDELITTDSKGKDETLKKAKK
jgi:uncharacterized protein (TIGR03066 family)